MPMPALIAPPPKSPPFLKFPFSDDPVVRQAEAIRDSDRKAMKHTGFRGAMAQLRHAIQAEIEDFEHNVAARVRDAKSQCDHCYTDLVSKMRQIETSPGSNDFAEIRDDLAKEISDEQSDVVHDGKELVQHLSDAEVEFDDFKRINRRKAEPRPPQNLPITLAILIALVVAEIVLNGFFFMDLTDHGLFGGVFEAFLFAPFNVLGSSLMGYYSMRYARHVNGWAASTAIASGIALLAFILGLNAYLAALRLSLRPDSIFDIPHLLPLIFSSRILEIMDYKSLGILVLGLALAGLACWKAYHLKDPYPGYDEIGRKLQAAKDDISDLRDHYKSEIEEIGGKAVQRVTDLEADYLREAAKFRDLVNALKDERKRYDAVCAQISEAYAARQAHFRRIYVAAKELVSPELEVAMEENAITPRSPELIALLEQVPDSWVQDILDVDTKVRCFASDHRQAVKAIVMTATEAWDGLIADIHRNRKVAA